MNGIRHAWSRSCDRYTSSDFCIPIAVMALLLFCFWSLPVVAQELRRGETVTDRARPDFEAPGIRLGTFKLFPAVEAELMHDDNIFADNSNKNDDIIVVVAPELLLKADWSRADLELGTDLAIGRYTDFDNEDYDDWRIWGEGAAELGRGQLTAELRHEDLHEERISTDDRRGIKPTEYSVNAWSIGYRNPLGDFDLRADLGQRYLDFEDTQTANGFESNADRDRTENRLRARFGYSLSSGFQPFVRLSLTNIDYDSELDEDEFFRSSDGYDIVVGTAIDLSGQTFGEVFVGYIERDYDDARFTTIDGPIFGAELTWNITGLTTTKLSASRLIKSTTIVDASGIFDTGAAFEIDHELLRNLILSGELSFNSQDFEGIDRTDDIFGGRIEAVYMLNRYLQLLLGFDILNRDSSPADNDVRVYDRQRYYFGVRGQL